MTVTEEIITMQEREKKKKLDKPAKLKKKKEGRQWHFFRIVNVPYIYFAFPKNLQDPFKQV